MDIRIRLDDRIAAAAGGAIGTLGCAAAAAFLLRRKPRVQAAGWALAGRPVAYRLHLHGTGIELAPWERNLVSECVIRDAPYDAVRIGPVEPRPDEGLGSVIRDTMVTGAAGSGFRSGPPDLPDDEPEPGAGSEPPFLLLPAFCVDGHQFGASTFAHVRDRAEMTLHRPVAVHCPECDGDAEIPAGRYSVRGGTLIREDPGAEFGDEGSGGRFAGC